MGGSSLVEMSINRGIKESNELTKALLAEQVKTNEWLAHLSGLVEQLIQVSQGQPRVFSPQQR